MDLKRLLYAASHEWSDINDQICTMGITQYAVDQLTDVTHLQLPKVGTATTAEKPLGEIESVKAVFDLYAPVTGEVIEVNEAVRRDPSLINQDPYEKGWMLKIRMVPGSDLSHLMNYEKYSKQIAEGH